MDERMKHDMVTHTLAVMIVLVGVPEGWVLKVCQIL